MELLTIAACITGLLGAGPTNSPYEPQAAWSASAVQQTVQKAADIPSTPKGWKSTTRRSTGVVTFKPVKDREKKAEGSSEIRLYPRVLREGLSVDQWLHDWALRRKPFKGKFSSPLDVRSATLNLALATQKFRSLAGKEGSTICVAISVDGLYIRPMELAIFPVGSGAVSSAVFQGMMKELIALEKKAAKRDGRGLKLEVAPPKVKGITSGGSIKPGRYVGNRTYKDEAQGAVDVQLHANGEFEIVSGFRRNLTGRYVYSESSGRLNLSNELVNSRYDPKADFCIYGKEAGGNMLIYAEEDRGFASSIYRLRYQGPVTRRPPSEVARIEAELKAEAKRYKWVTELGKGVRKEEIEAVVATSRGKIISGAYNLDEDIFLLMKDGRVMHGMPVPPEDLHVAFSRSREPDRWGHWIEFEGEYRFAWPARPDAFEAPPGVQTICVPFEEGARVDGRFGAASSTSTLNGGSASFWGIILGSEGYFKKWRNGIAGYGNAPGLSDVMANVYVGYDEEGSSVSVNADGYAGGSTSSNATSLRDRSGRYSFVGYTATLTYGNGQVERLPSFYTSNQRNEIWLGTGSLRLEKEPEPERGPTKAK